MKTRKLIYRPRKAVLKACYILDNQHVVKDSTVNNQPELIELVLTGIENNVQTTNFCLFRVAIISTCLTVHAVTANKIYRC